MIIITINCLRLSQPESLLLLNTFFRLLGYGLFSFFCWRFAGLYEKFAVADHMWGQNHKILFNETQLLSNVIHYSTRIYREALEIQKHKNSFNKKEESLKISDTWLPALRETVKKQTKKDLLLIYGSPANPWRPSLLLSPPSRHGRAGDGKFSAQQSPIHSRPALLHIIFESAYPVFPWQEPIRVRQLDNI